MITFGQFRAIDLGDLLWNNELDLVCPSNPVGTVDVYFVTHHGLDASGAPPLVHGVQPRVAIMQNGTRKGAGAQAMATIRSSPGLEDLWQLHWSYNAGIEQNSAGVFIANVDDAATIANVLDGAATWRRSRWSRGSRVRWRAGCVAVPVTMAPRVAAAVGAGRGGAYTGVLDQSLGDSRMGRSRLPTAATDSARRTRSGNDRLPPLVRGL